MDHALQVSHEKSEMLFQLDKQSPFTWETTKNPSMFQVHTVFMTEKVP